MDDITREFGYFIAPEVIKADISGYLFTVEIQRNKGYVDGVQKYGMWCRKYPF